MGGTALFSERVDATFQGEPYSLRLVAKDDALLVEVDRRADGARWRGDFSARYVEDITAKTGNFKKFGVFVRMLRSAVNEETDSVFVDLLTYSDLEGLKSQRASQEHVKPVAPSDSKKRYLILTYAAEFDRVHYPLPLHEDDIQPLGPLQEQVRRMQQQASEPRHEPPGPGAAPAAPALKRPGSAGPAAGRPAAAREEVYDDYAYDEEEEEEEEQEPPPPPARPSRPHVHYPAAPVTAAGPASAFAHSGSSGGGPAVAALRDELRRMREENGALRAQLLRERELTAAAGPLAGPGGMGLGSDAAALTLLVSRQEAQLRRLDRDLRVVGRERDVALSKLEAREAELDGLKAAHARAAARRTREAEAVVAEVRRYKDAARALRSQCRELGTQLDAALRRAGMPSNRAGHRDGSRGPSPAASRSSSRGPTPRGPSPVPSRPSSAPRDGRAGTGGASRPPPAPPAPYRYAASPERFDPTAYILKRQSAARAAMERLKAGPQPLHAPEPMPARRPGSAPPMRSRSAEPGRSAAGTAPTSRPASRPRSASASGPATPRRERAGSSGGSGLVAGAGGVSRAAFGSSVMRDVLPPVARPAAGLPSGWGAAALRASGGGLLPLGAKPPLGAAAGSVAGVRASSPGRALQDVKAKLAQYANKAGGRGGSGTGAGGRATPNAAPPPAAKKPAAAAAAAAVYSNASAEIADIDARLSALQSFLRAAKSAPPV